MTVRKFKPPNRLAKMIKERGGLLAQDAIAAAEAGVESLREASLAALDETLAEIESTLRSCGIADILVLDNEFPMEYCDDCGAPMYPSPEGEAVHAELPEEQAEQMPKHLH